MAERMVRCFEDAQDAGGGVKAGDDAGLLVVKAGYDLLDLDAADAVQGLADLVGRHVALRFSMELVLDKALDTADRDAASGSTRLRSALQDALGPHEWPHRAALAADADALLVHEGELRFPFLDHLDTDELARFYVDFLHNLPVDNVQRDYGLDVVIRLNRALFYKQYEGFICAGVRYVRFDRLISQAARADHDPMVPMEEYVQRGHERAQMSGCKTAADHLAAFVAADRFQLARCREIHTVLSLGADIPEWIRADIFRVLEHEAMKQVHATQLMEEQDGLVLVAGMPMLRKALQTNASGEVSEMLQRLLRETLSPSGYAGAAGEFAARATARAEEWQLNGPESAN